MKVKALTSFGGIISMDEGEIREITNEEVLKDLLSSKYIEEVKKQRTLNKDED